MLGLSIVVLLIAILILASVPPVSRDALTHHLAVPKLWLDQGLFKELPSIPFSYYPMNLDLLYLIPLFFSNDIVPKYIHFAFALLTAYLIFNYLKSRLSTSDGLLGALFFLSIPIIVKLSTTVYVDLGLIFFSTAALLGLIEWMEADFKLKPLLLSAFCCGLALGTKYNGLIVLLLLSIFIPFIYLRRPNDQRLTVAGRIDQLRALGYGMIFAVVALLVFSPWMIRNAVLTGNPIYPLYNSAFQKEKSALSDQVEVENQKGDNPGTQHKKDGWKHFAVRKMVYGESLWQICLIPIRVFFEGEDDNPKHFDGQLNPFLLILPLLLLIPGDRHDGIRKFENRLLFLFAFIYLTIVFFKVDMRIRWIGPIIPCLVILSVSGLARVRQAAKKTSIQWKSRCISGGATIMVAVMFLMNLSYIHNLCRKIDPLPYIAGKIDRDVYIERFIPEYALIRYINQRLPDNAVTLCLFIGNRIYYFDNQVNLDKKLFVNAVSGAGTVEEIGANLERLGITHLLMRYDLTYPWIKRTFDEQKEILLKTYLQKHAKQLTQSGGYGLFELNDIH